MIYNMKITNETNINNFRQQCKNDTWRKNGVM